MKIGVYWPPALPFSIENYIECVFGRLSAKAIDLFEFSDTAGMPRDVDMFWDPRSSGGAAPYAGLLTAPTPVVVTVHGAAPFAVRAREYFPDWSSALRGKIRNWKRRRDWRAFQGRCSAIITASNFAEGEIRHFLRLDADRIVPVHHGVDTSTFRPSRVGPSGPASYFLHVSQYQPVKNLERIIAAYLQLTDVDRPKLLIVAPGASEALDHPEVDIVRTRKTQTDLAVLYRGATGFVFPSLRESFGMPILEAMASGCPVITSNCSACAEIAGDAALLVDPRSVKEIAAAMRRVASDRKLRGDLRERGLARAAQFSWHRSAEQHLAVFERALHDWKIR